MIGDPVIAKNISDILLSAYGHYAQPINYPTVPRGTERLRFTPTPNHTNDHIDSLVSALCQIRDRIGFEAFNYQPSQMHTEIDMPTKSCPNFV
jgi:5-aminolevulinate synthase